MNRDLQCDESEEIQVEAEEDSDDGMKTIDDIFDKLDAMLESYFQLEIDVTVHRSDI